MTPDFDGLPNLERFKLYGCECLEEIHPSIGRLERLVFLSVAYCESLKTFPPMTRLKKLETLEFISCPKLFNSEKEVASFKRSFTKQEPSLPHNNMNHHIGLRFFLRDLTRMNVSYCRLGDEYMGSAVWELPNLKTLDLSGNDFSRLSFNLLQLPQLKWLDVTMCLDLVELSELPSSIAVVIADHCRSLESFGDISNCKWLWNVSQKWEKNKLCGDILLDSMLQGNAIEDYFINVAFEHQIPKGFAGRLFRGENLALHLPDYWYNDFCGFSIYVVTTIKGRLCVGIVMKQEVDEDSLSESKEAVEPKYADKSTTYVGYVSFGSLRHTAFSDPSFTMISVSVHPMYGNSLGVETYVGVELVPRKSKGDQPQTTKVPKDSSEFWEEDPYNRRQPFRIKHDSRSSIKIKWNP